MGSEKPALASRLTVGVVVCAYNEERHIRGCILALLGQLEEGDDLVVVDDGSTDATASIADNLGVKVLRRSHCGPAAGRNAGARLVTGEILMFVDGDMHCMSGYIERMSLPFADPDCVGTFAKDMHVGRPHDAWSTAYCFIRRLAHPRLLPADSPDESANIRAIRRKDFLAVGGYDDVGYGEDMTLAPKLGGLARAAVGASLVHFNPDTPKEIFDNGRWIGRGFDVQYVAHPVRDNLPWTALRHAWRYFSAGAPWQIFPARLMYGLGFLVGLASRRARPRHHWK